MDSLGSVAGMSVLLLDTRMTSWRTGGGISGGTSGGTWDVVPSRSVPAGVSWNYSKECQKNTMKRFARLASQVTDSTLQPIGQNAPALVSVACPTRGEHRVTVPGENSHRANPRETPVESPGRGNRDHGSPVGGPEPDADWKGWTVLSRSPLAGRSTHGHPMCRSQPALVRQSCANRRMPTKPPPDAARTSAPWE